ncbi:hypothetical protein NFI96_004917 [Prochilodus magdalenae]|nr:hypothetical protein NFI96_004917 [Prochilodus magdalenae]
MGDRSLGSEEGHAETSEGGVWLQAGRWFELSTCYNATPAPDAPGAPKTDCRQSGGIVPFVCPAMDWQPVQGVPCFPPSASLSAEPVVRGRVGGSAELGCSLTATSDEPTSPTLFPLHVVEWLEHPNTVPADGAVGMEVEGHQAFWTCDDKPFILVLTTVPPHTDSLGVSTKTKAGLVPEDDPLPF